MLARLEAAGLVSTGAAGCRAGDTSSIFAVQRIIAVEAKVSATRRLLEQASANAWFSSESHVLLPSAGAGSRMARAAASLGVGVLALDNERLEAMGAAVTRSVPRSYASWLFNEWTWRLARLNGTL